MLLPPEQHNHVMFSDFLNNTLKPGVSAVFGDPAVYSPITGDPVPCSVVLEEDSDLRPVNIDVGVVEVGTTIEALVDQVGEPLHGSTFLVNGVSTYRVARTDANDGEFIKLVVNEVI